MKYNEHVERAHRIAVKNGLWNEKHSHQHAMMLILTEIAHMVEADRYDCIADILSYKYVIEHEKTRRWWNFMEHHWTFPETYRMYIKNTIQDKMADTVIGLFDLAGELGYELDCMPECNYHRDYERYSFTDHAYALCKGLIKEGLPLESRIKFGLKYIEDWAGYMGIDLWWHIDMKMQYNETRGIRYNRRY